MTDRNAVLTTEALGFPPPGLLVERYCRDFGVPEDDAIGLFNETKRFLAVCAAPRDFKAVPSAQIDEMWHRFIVFTRDYESFCTGLAGRYIHHQPTPLRDSDAYRRTRARAEAMFGPLPTKWWAGHGASCDDGDDGCEACYCP